MAAKFEDHTRQTQEKLREIVDGWMYETMGRLHTGTVKKSRTGLGQTKGSYQYRVIEKEHRMEGHLGSNLENAIWEEYGTGEYALGGKGRKTPWYVPVEGYQGKKRPSYNGKVVIVYGKNGKRFYKTNGKKPNRPIGKAYKQYNRKKMLKDLAEKLRQAFG